MPKVLILTGPGGSGKSTIAQLIAKKYGYAYLDGDHEDTKFFPKGGQRLPKNDHLLEKSHHKILNKAKRLTKEGKSVVADYIIFGRYQDFIRMFQQEFGNDLEIKVLMPSEEEIVKRDSERKIWTAGPHQIAGTIKELNELKDLIGEENYLNTTGQTPAETIERHFSEKI